ERLPEGLKRIEQSMGHHGLEAFFRLCGYERIPGYLNQIVEKNRNLYLDKYLYTSFSILNNSISKQEKL
ncbi:hypothetical protein JXA85_07720, partial [Candidatus Woesearchaeota archaeon]|nr:hypothetical protein [Candidatus Woesearchaeota archaeon]